MPTARNSPQFGSQCGAQFSDPSHPRASQAQTERNAVEDPILSFPDPNHVGNAHLHINRHPEMR